MMRLWLLFTTLVFFAGWIPIADAAPAKVGFLVVAPDRGFLGNQEVRSLVDEFKKSYPAALGLIGREYTGVDGEYAVYLTRAVQELKQAGATEIVAIPLFLSASDPILKRITPTLPAYAQGLPLRWAPPMVEDYLIGQVVLDRVEALSQQPDQERLLLVGIGATDEASEKALKADVEKLLTYVTRYKQFRETETVIYYDRAAEGAETKNKEIKARVLAQIAKQGRTLVVPAFIGPRFDHSMSMTSWLGREFKSLNVAYREAEMLPHPNVLLWLKKTANRSIAASPSEIGVVIMPHGSTQPWNDAAERVIEPLKAKYKIEMAYGMGDPGIIQEAVSKLEQQGIKRIVFVRMYQLAHHMKPSSDYILGLAESPRPHGASGGHGHDANYPPQVRSAVLFSAFGGYEEYPEIAQVVCERIAEISKDPAKETVLLLAHGSETDQDNAEWISVMNANIERVKKDPRCASFKAIKAATVREDWPEQRERAVADVRKTIQENAKTGRVLVIANRLYGSGPYKKMLTGLDFEMNEKGLVHPVITRWLEEGIGRTTAALTGPLNADNRMAQR